MFDCSNFFIVADNLLKNKENLWVVRDFEHLKIDKYTVSKYFQRLCELEILKRNISSGKTSHCSLIKAKKLITLCQDTFKNPDMKSELYISRQDQRNILSGLKKMGFNIFLGKISGVSDPFYYSEDHKLNIYCLDKYFFTVKTKERLIFDLEMHKVKNAGSVIVAFPKYKKFLQYNSQVKNGYQIPSDFYTYLDLHTMDTPLAKIQIDHMKTLLKKNGGYFV